jgi:hypothetical protein
MGWRLLSLVLLALVAAAGSLYIDPEHRKIPTGTAAISGTLKFTRLPPDAPKTGTVTEFWLCNSEAANPLPLSLLQRGEASQLISPGASAREGEDWPCTMFNSPPSLPYSLTLSPIPPLSTSPPLLALPSAECGGRQETEPVSSPPTESHLISSHLISFHMYHFLLSTYAC